MDLGEKTRVVLDSSAWQEVMVPELKQLDLERSPKGPAPSYTSAELESVVLFQKLAGVATYREARNLLAGDRSLDAREALGFDKPRKRYGRGVTLVKSLDGVPSEVTVWRHLQRWGLERHIAAYEALFQRLLVEHLQDEDMRTEARTLNIDGSTVRSHYTSFERLNRKTGELKPPTLEGGGYMPRTEDNPGSDGHGFTMVAVTTSTGLPLAHRIVPLATKNETEPDTALRLFHEDWAEKVQPHLSPELALLTGDSAYKKQAFRAELREHGIVENCHAVSHAAREKSLERAKKADQTEWQIRGYRNWRANGHREIYCTCGEGRTVRRFNRDEKTGKATVRTEGQCRNCGSMTITSGKWRKAQNPRQFVRCLPGEETQADWSFGNPLTFNDKTARVFGDNRFGHNEGFHGHLQTRFGLLKHKAWYRRREQAQLDFLIVFSSMHALAMEQRKRAKEPVELEAKRARGPVRVTAPPGAPPGQAAAA